MKIHNKKLYKSKNDRIIFGVMGGLGEYFNIDPVLFRVIYIGLIVFTVFLPGIIAYILMALIMPNRPHIIHEKSHT